MNVLGKAWRTKGFLTLVVFFFPIYIHIRLEDIRGPSADPLLFAKPHEKPQWKGGYQEAIL